MTADAKQVLEAALELVEEERREVAEVLLESLDVSEAEFHGAWRDEILRRVKQVRAGEVELESWDDVRQLGRDALAQR